MRTINFYFKIFFIIFAIISLVSCDKKMLPNKLTIGSYYAEGDSLLFIAENKELFKKNGVNVEIIKYESGAMAIEEVVKDKIDISCCSEAAFVTKSFDNPNLRIIVVYTILESQKIFTPSETGIKTSVGLKGKKIGITKGSSAEFALAAYLSLNNMNSNEVKIIYLAPNEYLNAIKDKKIDAIVTWEPHIYNIKNELNNNIVDLSEKKIPQIFMLLNAKNEIIQKKRLEIDALLKSLKEAEEYLKKNNSNSKKIVKEKMNASDDYINYVAVMLVLGVLLQIRTAGRHRVDQPRCGPCVRAEILA